MAMIGIYIYITPQTRAIWLLLTMAMIGMYILNATDHGNDRDVYLDVILNTSHLTVTDHGNDRHVYLNCY